MTIWKLGGVRERDPFYQYVTGLLDIHQPWAIGSAFFTRRANIFPPALPPDSPPAVNGAFPGNGDVAGIGNADKRQPAIFRFGIAGLFIGAPAISVEATSVASFSSFSCTLLFRNNGLVR